jgi:hypothetical protein
MQTAELRSRENFFVRAPKLRLAGAITTWARTLGSGGIGKLENWEIGGNGKWGHSTGDGVRTPHTVHHGRCGHRQGLGFGDLVKLAVQAIVQLVSIEAGLALQIIALPAKSVP